MKVTLNTQSVRTFLDASRVITTDKSDVQPVLKYVLFKIEWNTCTVIKSNYYAFCKSSFLCENQDCEFLINDETLRNFVGSLKANTFTVNVDSGVVTLISANSRMKSPNGDYDSKIYHEPPKESKDKYTIAKEVLSWLKYAANFLPQDANTPVFGSAYIKNNILLSSDGNRILIRRLEGTYPDANFSETEIRSLSQFNTVEYSLAGNFNTYKNGAVILGFIKRENQNPFDVTKFLELSCDGVLIKADDILNFCSSTIQLAKDTFANCIFTVKNKKITLSYFSDDHSKENHVEFDITSNSEFEFKFSPTNIKNILSDYPFEFIKVGMPSEAIVMFTSDADDKFLCLTQNLL